MAEFCRLPWLTLGTIAASVLATSCEPQIIAPEHAKCTVLATGETFTARKENMKVMGDFFFITDDTGKVRIWQLIPEDSDDYQVSCVPNDQTAATEVGG